MTQHPSRKEFFAKLAGFAAAVAVAPRWFGKAKPVAAVANRAMPAARPAAALVRPDARAVARNSQRA